MPVDFSQVHLSGHVPRHHRQGASSRRRTRAKRRVASTNAEYVAIRWWLQRSWWGLVYSSNETEQEFLFRLYQGRMYLMVGLFFIVAVISAMLIAAYDTVTPSGAGQHLFIHLAATAACSFFFGLSCVVWLMCRQSPPPPSSPTRNERIPATADNGNLNEEMSQGLNPFVLRHGDGGSSAGGEATELHFEEVHHSPMSTQVSSARAQKAGGPHTRSPMYVILTQQSEWKQSQVCAFEIYTVLLGLCIASVCSFQFYEMALCERLLSPADIAAALAKHLNPCTSYIPTVDIIAQITLVVILAPRALLTIPLVLLCIVAMFVPAFIGGSVVLATSEEMGIQGAVQATLLVYLLGLSVLQDRSARRLFEDSVRLDLALIKTVDVRREMDELLEVIFPDKQVLDRIISRKSVIDRTSVMAVSVLEVRDFLNWSTTMLPADAINVVGFLYGMFDRWANAFGVDHVKAVGDRYLACCGLSSGTTSSSSAVGGHQRPPHAQQEHARSPTDLVRSMLRFTLRQQKIIHEVNLRVHNVLEPVAAAIAVHVGPGLGILLGSQYVMSYEVIGQTVVTVRQMVLGAASGRVTASEEAALIARQQHHRNSTECLASVYTPPSNVSRNASTLNRRRSLLLSSVNTVVATSLDTTSGSRAVSPSCPVGNSVTQRTSIGHFGDHQRASSLSHPHHNAAVGAAAVTTTPPESSSSPIGRSGETDKEFTFTALQDPLELMADGRTVRSIHVVDVQPARKQATYGHIHRPSTATVDDASISAQGITFQEGFTPSQLTAATPAPSDTPSITCQHHHIHSRSSSEEEGDDDTAVGRLHGEVAGVAHVNAVHPTTLRMPQHICMENSMAVLSEANALAAVADAPLTHTGSGCLQNAIQAVLEDAPSPRVNRGVEASAEQSQRLRYLAIVNLVKVRREHRHDRRVNGQQSASRHGTTKPRRHSAPKALNVAASQGSARAAHVLCSALRLQPADLQASSPPFVSHAGPLSGGSCGLNPALLASTQSATTQTAALLGFSGTSRRPSTVLAPATNEEPPRTTKSRSGDDIAVPFGRVGFEMFLKQLRPDIAREIEAEDEQKSVAQLRISTGVNHDDADHNNIRSAAANHAGVPVVSSPVLSASIQHLSDPAAFIRSSGHMTLSSNNPSGGPAYPSPSSVHSRMDEPKLAQPSEVIASQLHTYTSLLDIMRRGVPAAPPTKPLSSPDDSFSRSCLDHLRWIAGKFRYLLFYHAFIRRVFVPFESPIVTAAYRRFHIRHSWRWKQIAYCVHAWFLAIIVPLIGVSLLHVHVRLPNGAEVPSYTTLEGFVSSTGFALALTSIVLTSLRFGLGLKRWGFYKASAAPLHGLPVRSETGASQDEGGGSVAGGVGPWVIGNTKISELEKYTFQLVQEVAATSNGGSSSAPAFLSDDDDEGDEDDDADDEESVVTNIKFPRWYIADLALLATIFILDNFALSLMPRGIINNEAVVLFLHHIVITYLVTTCYMHMIVLSSIDAGAFICAQFVFQSGSERTQLLVLYFFAAVLMAWSRELKQVYHFELLSLHRAVLNATREELSLQRHVFAVLLPPCLRERKTMGQIAAHRRTLLAERPDTTAPLLPPIRLHYAELCTLSIRLDPMLYSGVVVSPAVFVEKLDLILSAVECAVYQANAHVASTRNPRDLARGRQESSSTDDDHAAVEGDEFAGTGAFGQRSSAQKRELISRVHVKGDVILFAGPMIHPHSPSNSSEPQRIGAAAGENAQDDSAPCDPTEQRCRQPSPQAAATERLVGNAMAAILMISRTLLEAASAENRYLSEHHQLVPPGCFSTSSVAQGSASLISSFHPNDEQRYEQVPISLARTSSYSGTAQWSHDKSPRDGASSPGGAVTYLRLSSIACLGSGFITILGSRGLTPTLMGAVARQSSALLSAAPTGFHGCSSQFLHSLELFGVPAPKTASPAASPASPECEVGNVEEISNDGDLCPRGIVLQAAQRWRVRGNGIMTVCPFGLDTAGDQSRNTVVVRDVSK